MGLYFWAIVRLMSNGTHRYMCVCVFVCVYVCAYMRFMCVLVYVFMCECSSERICVWAWSLMYILSLHSHMRVFKSNHIIVQDSDQ